jgi:transposase-like protein
MAVSPAMGLPKGQNSRRIARYGTDINEENRKPAVRLAMDQRDEHQGEAAALTAIAGKLIFLPDTLGVWFRQAQPDAGKRPGQTTAETAWIKELEREVRARRQANDLLVPSRMIT